MNDNVMDTVQTLVNLRPNDCSSDAIWAYIRSYHKQLIYGSGILTRLKPDLILVPTQADGEKTKSWLKSIATLPRHPVTEFDYLATDRGEGAEILRSAFIKIVNEMKDFLTVYRENGRPPFTTLDEKFRRLSSQLSLSLQEEKSKFSIAFNNIPQQFGFIEDYIDYYLYLLPALNGDFDLWRKNRICKECGNIFFYKLDRAQFCSTPCQMRGAYKRRNEK